MAIFRSQEVRFGHGLFEFWSHRDGVHSRCRISGHFGQALWGFNPENLQVTPSQIGPGTVATVHRWKGTCPALGSFGPPTPRFDGLRAAKNQTIGPLFPLVDEKITQTSEPAMRKGFLGLSIRTRRLFLLDRCAV